MKRLLAANLPFIGLMVFAPAAPAEPPERGWRDLVDAATCCPQVLQQTADWAGHREFTEMLLAVMGGSRMGPGGAWFHPGQSRYDWKWLAGRFDANQDARISRTEFRGGADSFAVLDRDRDGFITAGDLNWSGNMPPERRPSASKSNDRPKQKMQGPMRDILIAGLLKGELGSPFEGPSVNDMAPNFDLPTHDGTARFSLAQFRGRKPVVLIFGSFT